MLNAETIVSNRAYRKKKKHLARDHGSMRVTDVRPEPYAARGGEPVPVSERDVRVDTV